MFPWRKKENLAVKKEIDGNIQGNGEWRIDRAPDKIIGGVLCHLDCIFTVRNRRQAPLESVLLSSVDVKTGSQEKKP